MWREKVTAPDLFIYLLNFYSHWRLNFVHVGILYEWSISNSLESSVNWNTFVLYLFDFFLQILRVTVPPNISSELGKLFSSFFCVNLLCLFYNTYRLKSMQMSFIIMWIFFGSSFLHFCFISSVIKDRTRPDLLSDDTQRRYAEEIQNQQCSERNKQLEDFREKTPPPPPPPSSTHTYTYTILNFPLICVTSLSLTLGWGYQLFLGLFTPHF